MNEVIPFQSSNWFLLVTSRNSVIFLIYRNSSLWIRGNEKPSPDQIKWGFFSIVSPNLFGA